MVGDIEEWKLKTYRHDNGRRCIKSQDGKWRHWDHEPPEPGPREKRDYICRMDHYLRYIEDRSLIDNKDYELIMGAMSGFPTVGRPLREDTVIEWLSNAHTGLARRIADRHLPETMRHFLMRNAEYGDDDDFNLGSRGQYVDISRKVQKLKRRLWEGEPEPDEGMGESTRVIVMELVGHLLMTLDYMEQEDGQAEEGTVEG